MAADALLEFDRVSITLGGRLIGAASVAAHRGGKWQGAYSATKFAVRGLSQSVAQELAEHGITVNVYSPGVVETPMWNSIDEALATRRGTPVGSELQASAQGVFQGASGFAVLAAGLWAGFLWGVDGRLPLLISGIVGGVFAVALLAGGIYGRTGTATSTSSSAKGGAPTPTTE